MTDRMTERFDTPNTPTTSGTDAPLLEDNDLGASSVGTGSGSQGGAGGADAKKQAASAVAQDAKESTKSVASTAASEVKDVAADAGSQLRQLFGQLSSEATDQASGQTQRAVEGLRALGNELSGMADSQQDSSGLASNLARQGASRISGAADWLDGRQPGELLEEVRSFARRRPGAFIAGAAVLGLIGGRLTRGLTADSSSSDNGGSVGATGSAGSISGGTTSVGFTDSAYAGGSVYGTGTGYPAEPVDLTGTDPTRVDAGIDPATYSHPGTSTGLAGEPR